MLKEAEEEVARKIKVQLLFNLVTHAFSNNSYSEDTNCFAVTPKRQQTQVHFLYVNPFTAVFFLLKIKIRCAKT